MTWNIIFVLSRSCLVVPGIHDFNRVSECSEARQMAVVDIQAWFACGSALCVCIMAVS